LIRGSRGSPAAKEGDMAIFALLNHLPLLALLLLAAVIDLRQRRIPNWLTLGLILSGLACATAAGGAVELGHALAGLLAGAAVAFVLFALGALGGGDVKLLAGVGAWLGAPAVLIVFVVQCLIGLGLVLLQSLRHGRTLLLLRNSAILAAGMAQPGGGFAKPTAGESGPVTFTSIDRPLPYAVPVALAVVAVLAAQLWMTGAAMG
jgi:prepilin peptidase CpaA